MNSKIKTIGFVCAALSLLTGCNKADSISESACERNLVLEVLSPGRASTKTWMGEAESGVFPVFWSDGDKICVNGVSSSAITVKQGEKLSKASFNIRNVEAPFRVVYPSSDCKDFDEASGNYVIDVPVYQKYVPESFSCGAAILYGTAQREGEAVQLKNLCGAIKITLKDESAVIKSLLLTSNGGTRIAGKFTLDITNGKITPLEGEGGYSVSVSMPDEGVRLTPGGTSFIITIPQGSYPEGFCLKFMDETKHILRNYWLRSAKGAEAGVEVKAGQIVVFEAAEYNPDAREISSAADWEEFAAAYNSGLWEDEWLGRDGTVKVSGDFSAASLTAIEDFANVLDANGHTITQTSGTHPLFNTLSGTVRNLTLAGKMTPSDPSTLGAAVFASTVASGALIESCVNKMNINGTSSKKTVAAAFARTMTGGGILNCTNDGEIYVNVDVNSSDQPVVAAGFVGTVSSLTSKAFIRNCTNNAAVKVIVTKSAGCPNRPVQAGYGGIVGTVVSGNADNYLTVENCSNNAAVSASYSVSPTSANSLVSCAGGIAGSILNYNSTGTAMWWWTKSKPSSVPSEDCVYAVLKNCVNNAKISNDHVSSCSSDDPTKCYAGGIAGAVNGLESLHVKVEGCKNYGVVVGHEGKYSRSCFSSAIGGLAGMAAYADFQNCIVKSAQIGSSVRCNYSTSGAIGYVVASFKLKSCKVFADMYHVRITNYTDQNYAMGFTLSTKAANQGGLYCTFVKIDGSEVSDCMFGGSVTYNTTSVEYSKPDSFKFDKKETLTASNVSDFVASASFYVDAEKKGFPDKVTFSNNTIWDGKE